MTGTKQTSTEQTSTGQTGTEQTGTAGPGLAAAIAARAADRPRLRLGVLGDEIDLADALALAAGRAAALLASGLRPGDRIALVAPNSTDYLVTWLAALLAGTPVALVNPTYPAPLLDELLAPLAPLAVLDAAEISRARRGRRLEDWAGLPGLRATAADTVSFMHTSGTSGVPKLCVQSGGYFLRLGRAMAVALELTAQDRVLAPLPLFHINPLGYGVITALLAGADALTAERFSAGRFWPDVVSAGITVSVLHAPPVEILKRATTPADARGHRIRAMFYADAEFQRDYGIPVGVSAYGSTEVGGVSHLARWVTDGRIPPDASRHGGTVRADLEARLGPDGAIFVRERERGAMFDGYLTAAGLDTARDADGWFDTGDLGRAEEHDRLVFLERRSESIRVKGEFVPIPFVENELGKVDGIADCALWKRPGELVDDEVVAYVVADEVSVQAVQAQLAHLPAFMRPVALARVAALPRDAAAGKVQRRRLAEQPVLEWVPL